MRKIINVMTGEVIIDEDFVAPSFPVEVRVPQSVSMAQARQALMDAGLFDAIDGGLNALPDGPTKRKALTFWEYSPTVSRNGELVTMLAAQFGLTDEQLDALFLAASEIKG
jgi:hypothetical protein